MRFIPLLCVVLLVACSSSTAFSQSRSLLAKDPQGPSDSSADAASNKSQPTKVPAKPASFSGKDKDAPKEMRPVERKAIKETPGSEGGESYLLRYKFEAGLRIASEVTHLAKTDTKIDSAEQNSNSRTVSHKTWDVIKVENGQMTFEYRILDVDMSQRVGQGPELHYSSTQSEPPHPQFKSAAESIGRVISTVTIDDRGVIIARSDDTNPPNLGMGDITLPLPENAVAIGATWETPRELRIRRDDGSLKPVRFRELFKLEKVSSGVATVSVRSEMITIITEAKEEAQVLQQLSNGTIKFDIDAGRMISKELSWDKRVVGFSGSGSFMEYSARLDEHVTKSETFTPSPRTAAK